MAKAAEKRDADALPFKELMRVEAVARSALGEQPRKRFFRQRAHSNPLSIGDSARPLRPESFVWDALFDPSCPAPATSPVEMIDVGCGFGGLLFGLNAHFPGARKLGLEIRNTVAEYVRLRIMAARAKAVEGAGSCAVLRLNAMRQLPCFFPRASVGRMFFCFPDPHFKRAKHRRRILSPSLLSEYAFVLRPGGRLLTITDVPALHAWMRDHLDEHACFRRVEALTADDEACVLVMRTATEEGAKARREGREFEWNVYERLDDTEARRRADALAGSRGFFESFPGSYGGVAMPRTDRGTNDAPAMFLLQVRERERLAAEAARAAHA